MQVYNVVRINVKQFYIKEENLMYKIVLIEYIVAIVIPVFHT